MKTFCLPLAEIVMSAGTQVRQAINTDTVAEYAEAMERGDKFPPVVVFHVVEGQGRGYVLADGFHRWTAAKRNDETHILADVRQGTRLDALKFALGANTTHGLRRTNADKRQAVRVALAEPKLSKLSNRLLANICALSPTTVGTIRNELSKLDSSIPEPEKRIGADGKQRKLKLPKAKEPDGSPPCPLRTKLEQAQRALDRVWSHLVRFRISNEDKPLLIKLCSLVDTMREGCS
jgi:ParB-like chromosome segregation protein Spo0J